MIVSIIYFDKNQYIYKEGIVINIDFEYKKSVTIVDKTILISNILTIDY